MVAITIDDDIDKDENLFKPFQIDSISVSVNGEGGYKVGRP